LEPKIYISQPYSFLSLRLSLSLIFLSALLPFRLSAQNYHLIPPTHELQSVNLNCPDDIGSMQSFQQSDDGYLWIATSKGILIFDGNKSILYNNGNPKFPIRSQPDHSQFSSLKKDKQGHLYAANTPANSIVTLDPQERKVLQEWPLSKSDHALNFMYDVANQEQVYAATWESEFDSVHIWKLSLGNQPELLFEFNSKQYGQITSYSFSQSMHWVQTQFGVLRISADGHHFDFYAFGHPAQSLWHTEVNKDQFFFYDDAQHAIQYWDSHLPSPKVYTHIPTSLIKQGKYFTIQNNIIYIGTGSSFYILDTLQHSCEDLSHAYYKLKINDLPGSLSEEIFGFAWADGYLYYLGSKNLYRLQSSSQVQGDFLEPLPDPKPLISMRGITEDEHQNVYASYYTGIAVKSKKDSIFSSFAPIRRINPERYSSYSLTYRSPYLFWHSLRINVQSGEIKSVVPNSIQGHIVQLLSNDTLWLYTWYSHELYSYAIADNHLDSISFESSKDQNENFPYIITKMMQSSDPSSIWMATRMEGIKLVSKKGKVIRSYSHQQLGASQEDGINDMLIDGDVIWYACYDGLGKLNTQTNEYVLYRDPLIHSGGKQEPRTIFSILPDGQNGFYLGTQHGLVYFDTLAKTFLHLDPSHPLAQPEFNRTSAFKDSRGRFYFGSTNGLFSFMPEELHFNPTVESTRTIKLYSLSIFNGGNKQYSYFSTSLNSMHSLWLSPSETNIEFSFSVPSFTNEIYYSYRIVGLNDQWNDYSTNNKVLLYSLPPGHYQLEVKASSNANDASASKYSLAINMSAYWYQQAWVIALLIVVISGLIALIIRYQFQQKLKRQKELEKLRVNISSNLHDDVGSILSGLAMQSQVMSYEMEENQRKPMLELSEMSREAMERMRDTVWAIDARKDKYENLIDRMRDFAEKNLERKNITHEFFVSGLDGKKFISPEVRQNIYLIFKEAITNIIKHSDGTHVVISFTQDGKEIKLVIHDNGQKNEPTKSDGLGMSNMQMRAKKIGGEIKFEDKEGFAVELILNRGQERTNVEIKS